jgi:hypothetical protein
VFFATGIVHFGVASTCNEDPVPSDRVDGLTALLVVVVVAGGPWWLAGGAKRRWTIAALGVVAALPALAGAIYGLRLESWRGTFCF